MSPEDFNFITKLLKDKSGLVITEDKMYLLESRLNPLARKTNFASIDDMIMALKGGNQVLIKQVIDAMTTNESFFFRDTKPFDQFRNHVLPYLLKNRADKKTIKIWSAACSSGQEAYSLCMILKDFEKELQGWTVEILGTDLSTDILTKAKEGLYTQFEVQRGLPIQFLVKFFTKQGEMWQISSEIRNMVQYKEANLLEDFSSLGIFDVIFCRNVLIYFDQADKTKVFEKLSKSGTSDCFLFLGGAETVIGVTDKYKPITGLRGTYVSSSISAELFNQITAEQQASVPVTSESSVFTSTLQGAAPKPSVNTFTDKPVFSGSLPTQSSQTATSTTQPQSTSVGTASAPTTGTIASSPSSATRPTSASVVNSTSTMATRPASSGVRPLAAATGITPTTATGIRPATTSAVQPNTGTRPMATTTRPLSTTTASPTTSSAVRPAMTTTTTVRPTTTSPATGSTAVRPTTASTVRPTASTASTASTARPTTATARPMATNATSAKPVSSISSILNKTTATTSTSAVRPAINSTTQPVRTSMTGTNPPSTTTVQPSQPTQQTTTSTQATPTQPAQTTNDTESK